MSCQYVKERKEHSPFIDNIWCADLRDMQLKKINKGILFLLRAIDVPSKYVWVILLENKTNTTIINALQKILDQSNRKPNKI